MAARLALSLALMHGLKNIILEGDSLVVRQAILQDRFPQDWTIKPIIADIQDLPRKMDSWTAQKVPRNANVCAHKIAQCAASCNHTGSIPLDVVPLLNLWLHSGKDPPSMA